MSAEVPEPDEIWENIHTAERVTITQVETERKMMEFYGVHTNVGPSNPIIVFKDANGKEGRWRLHKLHDDIGPDPMFGDMSNPAFTDCYRLVADQTESAAHD